MRRHLRYFRTGIDALWWVFRCILALGCFIYPAHVLLSQLVMTAEYRPHMTPIHWIIIVICIIIDIYSLGWLIEGE